MIDDSHPIECEHALGGDHRCLTLPDWMYAALHCAPLGQVMLIEDDWGLPIRSWESH